jgi:TRAP-type C4-dicarboxylate transport system permease small subunit
MKRIMAIALFLCILAGFTKVNVIHAAQFKSIAKGSAKIFTGIVCSTLCLTGAGVTLIAAGIKYYKPSSITDISLYGVCFIGAPAAALIFGWLARKAFVSGLQEWRNRENDTTNEQQPALIILKEK